MKNIFFAVATFDLYGKVESVNYDQGEHVLPVCVQFDTNGKVSSIVRTDSGGNKENAEILYDGLDKIETISFESDDPWINVLTYGDAEGFQAPVTYTTTKRATGCCAPRSGETILLSSSAQSLIISKTNRVHV